METQLITKTETSDRFSTYLAIGSFSIGTLLFLFHFVLYDTAAITTTTSTGTNVDNNKGTTRSKGSTKSTTTSTSTSINVDNNKATTRSKGKKRKEAVDVAESTALITKTKAAKAKTKGEWLYLIFLFLLFYLYFIIILFILCIICYYSNEETKETNWSVQQRRLHKPFDGIFD